jgi:multicomponent Na+:H+ antiporter subunit C
MTLLLSLCVCVIFAVSVYLVLSRELKSVAMGVFILSHALHLGILAMSGSPVTPEGEGLMAPVVEHEDRGKTQETLESGGIRPKYVDPLPQALILTAIVISFAVTAVMLTLLVVTHRTAGTLRVERLMVSDRPEPPGLAG